MLAHPNILQTYDHQMALLSESDVAKCRSSWEQQQQMSQARDDVSLCGSSRLLVAEARADSFEMLSPPSRDTLDAPGCTSRAGGSCSIDLWQVLFMLGARPGQFLTLIVMVRCAGV
ncbi:hypothetical protein TSOC_013601, partial [Tetrabaena socialis]